MRQTYSVHKVGRHAIVCAAHGIWTRDGRRHVTRWASECSPHLKEEPRNSTVRSSGKGIPQASFGPSRVEDPGEGVLRTGDAVQPERVSAEYRVNVEIVNASIGVAKITLLPGRTTAVASERIVRVVLAQSKTESGTGSMQNM